MSTLTRSVPVNGADGDTTSVKKARDLRDACKDILQVANARAVLCILHARAVVCGVQEHTIELTKVRRNGIRTNLSIPRFYRRQYTISSANRKLQWTGSAPKLPFALCE